MRIRTFLLAGLTAFAATAVMATAAQAATGNYVGNAYGTYANIENLVVAAPTAAIGFGCLTPPNSTGGATVATVNVPKVLGAGVINTEGATTENATTIGDTMSAKVAGLTALNGLVKVAAVHAVSSTSFSDATGFVTSAAGSSVTRLEIAGKAIPINVSPNTTVAIPGVGTATINEQSTAMNGTTLTFTVNMIDIHVTVAQPSVAVGTRIIIGHATSGLGITNPGDLEVLGGKSYATSIKVGGLVTSSPTFPAFLNVGIGCGSVDDGTLTDTGVGVQIPGIIQSGTLTQTATGHLGPTEATGDTTSTIEHLSLLGGLVTASVIKAESNATATPTSATTFTTDGSQLVGLTVGKKAIPVNVGENTKISVAGLTVWINRVIRTPTSLEVRMLEITGFTAKPPINGNFIDIRVAVAETES